MKFFEVYSWKMMVSRLGDAELELRKKLYVDGSGHLMYERLMNVLYSKIYRK